MNQTHHKVVVPQKSLRKEVMPIPQCGYHNVELLISNKKKGNTMKNLEKKVAKLMEQVKTLNSEIEEKDGIILDLQVRLEKSQNGSGRKSQVLDLLREFNSISILEIANNLNISTKNVSSQLTYLRSDGHQIFTDPKGRKVLVEKKEEPVKEEVPAEEEVTTTE